MPNGRGEYERPLSVRCASYPMFVSCRCADDVCVPGEARACVAPCRVYVFAIIYYLLFIIKLTFY